MVTTLPLGRSGKLYCRAYEGKLDDSEAEIAELEAKLEES